MSEPVARSAPREAARTPALARLALALTAAAGCSNGADSPDRGAAGGPPAATVAIGQAVEAAEAVAGSFVGEVAGTKAFVAVVAVPAAGGDGLRAVEVYVSDGRRLSLGFSGSIVDNAFVARSGDGSLEAEGSLSEGSVSGTVELPGGGTTTYEARPPSGAAGLYELEISPDARLSGASAAGLGVTGEIDLRRRGSGTLALVDGGRLPFRVARTGAGDRVRLRAGEVRLIVLPDGRLRGAGRSRPAPGRGDIGFFVGAAGATDPAASEAAERTSGPGRDVAG